MRQTPKKSMDRVSSPLVTSTVPSKIPLRTPRLSTPHIKTTPHKQEASKAYASRRSLIMGVRPDVRNSMGQSQIANKCINNESFHNEDITSLNKGVGTGRSPVVSGSIPSIQRRNQLLCSKNQKESPLFTSTQASPLNRSHTTPLGSKRNISKIQTVLEREFIPGKHLEKCTKLSQHSIRMLKGSSNQKIS